MLIKIFLLLISISISSENLDLEKLQKKLSSKNISVEDPVYKKKKNYEAFLLKDVLNFLNLRSLEPIEFTCSDGYKPIIEMDLIEKGQPYLVFRDTDFKNWEEFEVGKSKKTPGPFYLVWQNKIEEAQWPYQIVAISQINFRERFPKIYPQIVKLPKNAKSGFNTFRTHCLKCHSINLEGGELGPELNIPKNITEYRSKKYLKEFILDSNSYRAKSPMPPFKGVLTDREIDEVISYISWMKRSKSINPKL